MNWLKWHVGTFTDPKFAVIAKKTGQPKHAVIAVWAALLETACNDVKRGDVSSFNPEDIGIALDLEPEAVMAIFSAIMARGMVTDDKVIAAWDKRQTQDYSTDRVRKFREKQRGESHPVTASETDETRFIVSETPGNAEEKRGEEKRISKPNGLEARSPNGSRLPADWVLSDEWRSEAAAKRTEHGLSEINLDLEAELFRNHWHAQPGAKGRKVDWKRTWINWCLSPMAGRGNSRAGPPPSREQIERQIQESRW